MSPPNELAGQRDAEAGTAQDDRPAFSSPHHAERAWTNIFATSR